MRFRIPGRVITFGVLLALLCLSLPAAQPVAHARPYGWDSDSPPPPPGGDNDGVVVKAARITVTSYVASPGATSMATRNRVVIQGGYRGLLSLVRLGYWRLLIW
jgi:hypothetical protein